MIGRDGKRLSPAAERRLFDAASADPQAEPSPPPFFAARVRAMALDAAREAEAVPTVGAAAWRMLPIFGAVALVAASVTGYQSWQFSRERDAALARVLAAEAGGGDFVMAALFLVSEDVDGAGGRP